jgi:hypothetical protein
MEPFHILWSGSVCFSHPLDENCFYTSGVFVVNLGLYSNLGGMYEFDP